MSHVRLRDGRDRLPGSEVVDEEDTRDVAREHIEGEGDLCEAELVTHDDRGARALDLARERGGGAKARARRGVERDDTHVVAGRAEALDHEPIVDVPARRLMERSIDDPRDAHDAATSG